MKKYIIGILALIIIGFGGWYFASPYMALNGLKDAVEEGDADDLESRVDFPAVRESLKSDLKAKMTEELTKEDSDPFAALGLALADKLVDNVLDGLLTPQGIAKLIQKRNKGDDAAEGDATENEDSFDDFELKRIGLSKFRLINTKDENSPQLVFTRDGLSWKLSRVDMSEVDFTGALK